MLVNLTPDLQEIERIRQVSKEHNFDYTPQSDSKYLIETGIYLDSYPFNFSYSEFTEKLDGFNYNNRLYNRKKKEGESLLQFYCRCNKLWKEQYGVADNIEQIKEFYKKQIFDKKEKYVITVTPIYQDKENKGKGGGWRWHKWGEYIGNLNPQFEYLDDENFGEDFEYVLCFHLYIVL